MNPLIERYGNDPRWVNWRMLKVNGRPTKVPYAVTGRKASSTDPKTWDTHAEAIDADDNIGIVFTPARDLLGIDIDHCLSKETGKISHENEIEIIALLGRADTYAEISPSGEGLHLYIAIDGALDLEASRHAPYEAYTSGRYFTVTGTPFGAVRPVRTVSPDEALGILSEIGYPWKKEPKAQKSLPAAAPVSLTDQDALARMFRAKNGQKTEALYSGDISAHGNDDSKADMALCSHLAFWTGKDAVQMERLWLASPLGSRAKTQERADYRQKTIAAAIAACNETYDPGPDRMIRETGVELLFTLNAKADKVFTLNTENICRVLDGHAAFAGRLRFDAFKGSLELMQGGKWRMYEDGDDVALQTSIQVLYPCFGRVGKEMVRDAMFKVSTDNGIDSGSDWLRSLKWDGKARLDTWLSSTCGTPDDEYHRAVASNWLKGAVKRVMQPGCKFDYVLVLEGPQGSRKSSLLAALGREWHTETTMSTDSKDFFMQFRGKLFVEFSEGETMSRTEVKKMKAIITTQVDRYRLPYGRVTQDFGRRCVFAMTTNQTEYLKDETGNRRWLPVSMRLPQADTDWMAANRDQLFAEAYHRAITLNESLHAFPKEDTEREQELRRITDPNAERIAHWYLSGTTQEQRDAGVTVFQAFEWGLHQGFAGKIMDRREEMMIADAFRSVLRLDKRNVMHGGVRASRWFPQAAPAAAPAIPAPVQAAIPRGPEKRKVAVTEDPDDIINIAAKDF